MKSIVALFGVSLMGFAVATYCVDVKTGCCVLLFIAGAGLLFDSLKK